MIKVGDIVMVRLEYQSHKRKAIVTSTRGKHLLKGMIDVHFRGESLGTIVDIEDCRLWTSREFVKKWWLWF